VALDRERGGERGRLVSVRVRVRVRVRGRGRGRGRVRVRVTPNPSPNLDGDLLLDLAQLAIAHARRRLLHVLERRVQRARLEQARRGLGSG